MKKVPPIPAEYKELLDIMAEIIAMDYLKNLEREKGGEADE